MQGPERAPRPVGCRGLLAHTTSTSPGGAVAWVRYRVWAADWYTRTLRSLAGPGGNYDRFVGIEMAIDGALSSLSSAFDASTALIIQGAENALELNEPTGFKCACTRGRTQGTCSTIQRWPPMRRGQAAGKCDGSSSMSTRRWRARGSLSPADALARLRRLRNQVAHQDTLARLPNAGGPSAVRAFTTRDVDAFDYLACACDQVHDLTEQMVSLAIHLGAANCTTAGSADAGFHGNEFQPSRSQLIREQATTNCQGGMGQRGGTTRL